MPIKLFTVEVKANQVYEGKIVRLVDFGALVNILPGKAGLLHISNERISDIHQVLSVGQVLNVKVLEVDRQSRMKLSSKNMEDVEVTVNKE